MSKWGSWLRVKDTRGRESRTLAFVLVAFSLMSLRFALGGLGCDLGGFRFEVGVTSMIDYGAAVAAVLAVWLGREWINQRGDKNV